MPTHDTSLRDAYIDLLVRAVTNQLYERPTPPPTFKELAACAVRLKKARDACSNQAQKPSFLDAGPRMYYTLLQSMDRARQVHTMTMASGVANLVSCVRHAVEAGVRGDFIETGVWKGGLTILMRGILRAYGIADRRVWVADTFAGLPTPGEARFDDRVAYLLSEPLGHLAISLSEVKDNFARYDLLDDQVCFLCGDFADTLPGAPIESLAVARLDGDLYDSTMASLVHLYPRLSLGGYLIVDDYGLPMGCRDAVDEYRAAHDISEPVEWANNQIVFWRKTK